MVPLDGFCSEDALHWIQDTYVPGISIGRARKTAVLAFRSSDTGLVKLPWAAQTTHQIQPAMGADVYAFAPPLPSTNALKSCSSQKHIVSTLSIIATLMTTTAELAQW